MMIGDIVDYVNVPMPPDDYHEIRAKLLSSGWRVGWTAIRENFTCSYCGSVHAVSINYYHGDKPIRHERTFDVCLVCDLANEVKPVHTLPKNPGDFASWEEYLAASPVVAPEQIAPDAQTGKV